MSNVVLPEWAQELRTRYLAGESSIFLLHGNVNDLYPWEEEGKTSFVSLSTFLNNMLRGPKDYIIDYNLCDGFSMETKTQQKIEGLLKKKGQSFTKNARSLSQALEVMETLITDYDQNLALIVNYAETILPMESLNYMGEEEKRNLIRMLQWTKSDYLSASNNIVIMITENLSEVHRRFVSSTQLTILEVELPNTQARLRYANSFGQLSFAEGMDVTNFANVCAGLTLIQMTGIIRKARQLNETITFKVVNLRKKAIIEQECHGLVEFIAPEHDFSHVGGMKELKAELIRVANAIKKGHRNQVPMGMLFVGPMGTGKTFIGEAFAGESGLTCIKFKNFREKWVGSTEANFEKILQVVKALGYVLMIIDEADRSMGGQNSNDSGSSSRVIARLKEFMSNTEHRGRVVVVMMTNRPDKIDIDLKRPGRLDYKIPFFFPQDDETRVAIVEALIRKNKVQLQEGVDSGLLGEKLQGYSAAEIEAVLLRSMRLCVEDEEVGVSTEHLIRAAHDVIPSRDNRMLEYMELLAVFEASSKQMLPEKYRDWEADQIQQRLDELRIQLGRRI